jgi:type IV pilus assembly protein PilP
MKDIQRDCKFGKIIQSLITLPFLFQIGCTDHAEEDIQTFITAIQTSKSEDIEPLPELNSVEPSLYQGFHLRSPFDPSPLSTSKQPGIGSLDLDPPRTKETLEFYPIDSLKMIGYIKKNILYSALIQDPNGNIHRTAVGNYLGHHGGVVQKIDDQGLDLIEKECSSANQCSERHFHLPLSSR